MKALNIAVPSTENRHFHVLFLVVQRDRSKFTAPIGRCAFVDQVLEILRSQQMRLQPKYKGNGIHNIRLSYLIRNPEIYLLH